MKDYCENIERIIVAINKELNGSGKNYEKVLKKHSKLEGVSFQKLHNILKFKYLKE